MASTDRDGRHVSGPLSRWFWGGFIALLLLGLLLTLFAAIRSGKQWLETNLERSDLPPAWAEAIRVTLSGSETLYLDADSLPRIQAEVRNELQAQRRSAQLTLSTTLDDGLNPIFDQAAQHVPAFADWYYSLAGEYARLLHAAIGDLASFLTQQIGTRIFEPAGTAAAIDALTVRLDSATAEQLRLAAQKGQERVMTLVRASGAFPEGTEVRITGQWDADLQLGEHLTPYLTLTSTDIARQGLATSAGAAASAATAKKLGGLTVAKVAGKMGAKTSLGSLAGLAAKLGLKSAAKAGGTLGGAGAGAATSATICAGTGVGLAFAPGCALVGGAVTGLAVWLLVDKAVIEADEYLHREALEQELRNALEQQREDLRAALRVRYVHGMTANMDGLLKTFESVVRPQPITPRKDFVPARPALPRPEH